jgi:hypothetical protein
MRRVGTSAKVSPLAARSRGTSSHPPLTFGIGRSCGSCPRLPFFGAASAAQAPSSNVPFWSPGPLGRDREPKGRGRVRGAANLTRQANAGHSGGVPGWRLRTTQRTCFPQVFAGNSPAFTREGERKRAFCQAENYRLAFQSSSRAKWNSRICPREADIFLPIRPGVKEGASVRSLWPSPV